MPGQARHRAGQHGHLRVQTRVPDRPAAARRRRPELQPRFRQGHHPVSRAARQGGGAPLRAVLRALAPPRRRPTGATSARVDAYWEANIDLTDVVPALDLYDRDWPIWTYAEITPPAKFVHDEDGRRGMAISSLVSGGCIVSGASPRAVAAVHRRARCIPTRQLEGAVVLPYVDIGRRARLTQRGRRSRRAHPARGWWSARTRSSMRARFRRTDKGICLITQPMIDRLACMTPCGSWRSPRNASRWSRPAALRMSSARCRAALARARRAVTTLCRATRR